MGNGSTFGRSDALEDAKNFLIGSSDENGGQTTKRGSGNSNSKKKVSLGEQGLKNVLEKIDANPHYAEIHNNAIAKLKFAECLSDENKLKETYLNPNWTITLALNDQITKYQTEMKPRKNSGGNNTGSSSNGTTATTIQPENNNGTTVAPTNLITGVVSNLMTVSASESATSREEIKQAQEDVLDDMEELKKWSDPTAELTKKIKVKLLVSDIHSDNVTKQTLRRVVSPILSQLGVLPKFGMFHTALIIGPFKIEWNNSALCVPRKVVANAAFLAADLTEISTIKDFKETIDKLAKVIVEWNTKMKYVERNGNCTTGGNCQEFVDAVLQAIGVSYNFSGALKDFLDNMKVYGQCDMVFPMSPEFREKYSKKETSVTFKTHKQLDQFVRSLGAGFFMDDDFEPEQILLKSFDRAFWVKHLKFPEIEDFQPLKNDEETALTSTCVFTTTETLLCPFGDPVGSRSVVLPKE